ncbi:serine/threonine-protein kinase [Azospirillum argentinense]
MEKIELPRGTWYYDLDAPLGKPGGFGAVYSGRDEFGRVIAVKKLHDDAGRAAQREADIVGGFIGLSHRHVMPYLDAGKDRISGSVFIVMPRAEGNLRSLIESKGNFKEADVIEIISQIATGLSEVSNIVNRDLKPENILFLDGVWRITDFGIARLIDSATASKTLKGCMTPEYAAPEIWNSERATNATDIYALGCIGTELISGAPPFVERTFDGYANAHRSITPSIPRGSDTLRTLLFSMLAKSPGSRPSISRVLMQITSLRAEITSPSAAKLAAASVFVAERSAEEAAAAAAVIREKESLRQLIVDAERIFTQIRKQLFTRIEQFAPNLKYENIVTRNFVPRTISLGKARLTMTGQERTSEVNQKYVIQNIKAVCGGIIKIDTPNYKRSSSLWYIETDGGNYRWIEVSYFPSNPLKLGIVEPNYPMHLSPQDASVAHSVSLGPWGLAMTPRPIDGEEFDSFANRWMERFADGAQGNLRMPSYLPEN